jgi:peptide deformylase
VAILKVARMGHPVLTRVADPVDPEELADPALQRFLDDMVDTMRDERGVGLAAPQVHRSLRLFVMEPPRAERDDDEDEGDGEDDPFDGEEEDDDGEEHEEHEGDAAIVVVNPVLTFPGTGKIVLWEGCLSMPGLRGRTERARFVNVEALDRHGRPLLLELEGFGAAVVQHETDHLDGILFPARMPNPSLLAFEDELDRHGGVAAAEERAGG